jgi:hypothetical protein
MHDTPDTSDRLSEFTDAHLARVERLERAEDNRLVVRLAGCAEPIVDVKLAKYFPWSRPDSYVSVRSADGKEVALVRLLDELDDASRRIAEAELRDKIFNPRIVKILEFRHEFGIYSVTAETDRGRAIFQFRGRDDIRILSSTRALFRDADGNSYELPDLNALDSASRRHLLPFF